MALSEDIKVKVMAKIEKLQLELREMQVDHKSAWEMYGSELCGLGMLDEEEALRKKLQLLTDYYQGNFDIIENEKRFKFELETVNSSIIGLSKRRKLLESCLRSITEAKEGIFD